MLVYVHEGHMTSGPAPSSTSVISVYVNKDSAGLLLCHVGMCVECGMSFVWALGMCCHCVHCRKSVCSCFM